MILDQIDFWFKVTGGIFGIVFFSALIILTIFLLGKFIIEF